MKSSQLWKKRESKNFFENPTRSFLQWMLFNYRLKMISGVQPQCLKLLFKNSVLRVSQQNIISGRGFRLHYCLLLLQLQLIWVVRRREPNEFSLRFCLNNYKFLLLGVSSSVSSSSAKSPIKIPETSSSSPRHQSCWGEMNKSSTEIHSEIHSEEGGRQSLTWKLLWAGRTSLFLRLLSLLFRPRLADFEQDGFAPASLTLIYASSCLKLAASDL